MTGKNGFIVSRNLSLTKRAHLWQIAPRTINSDILEPFAQKNHLEKFFYLNFPLIDLKIPEKMVECVTVTPDGIQRV